MDEPPPFSSNGSEEKAAAILEEKISALLGTRVSSTLILRIVRQAKVYSLADRLLTAGKLQKDCEAIASSAAELIAGLERSAKYHETFSEIFGREHMAALKNVEVIANGLGSKKKGRPPKAPPQSLAMLIDYVLDALWSVTGSFKISTNTAEDGGSYKRYGPIHTIVEDALLTVGLPNERLPGSETIHKLAAKVRDAKLRSQ